MEKEILLKKIESTNPGTEEAAMREAILAYLKDTSCEIQLDDVGNGRKNCGMSTGICTWDKLAVCRQTSSRQCSSGSDWKGIPMQILCGDVWHLNCSRESV